MQQKIISNNNQRHNSTNTSISNKVKLGIRKQASKRTKQVNNDRVDDKKMDVENEEDYINKRDLIGIMLTSKVLGEAKF